MNNEREVIRLGTWRLGKKRIKVCHDEGIKNRKYISASPRVDFAFLEHCEFSNLPWLNLYTS